MMEAESERSNTAILESSESMATVGSLNDEGVRAELEFLRKANVALTSRVEELSVENEVANAKVSSLEAMAREFRSEMRSMRREIGVLRDRQRTEEKEEAVESAAALFSDRSVAGKLSVGRLIGDWLPRRQSTAMLERRHIVPPNYFEDPLANTKGRSLAREIIGDRLEEFYVNRATAMELQQRNILPVDRD